MKEILIRNKIFTLIIIVDFHEWIEISEYIKYGIYLSVKSSMIFKSAV